MYSDPDYKTKVYMWYIFLSAQHRGSLWMLGALDKHE
jgi:hypothetical protein